MKKTETIELLMMFRNAYPQFEIPKDSKELDAKINLWYFVFKDRPFELIKKAALALIKIIKFAPSIAEMEEQIRKILYPDQMTEQEAVNLVMKAISNSHKASKEFNGLPKILQRIVGTPNQLYTWGLMDVDTVQSVVASNISRSYRVLALKEREQQINGHLLEGSKIKELN